MDQFGVLTERYGLKPQGKSAPMSQAKRSTATASTTQTFGFGSGLTRTSVPSSSWDPSPSASDDHSFFPKQQPHNSFGSGDDFGFVYGIQTTKQSNMSSNHSSNGSLFDLDSMFNPGTKSSSSNLYVDDVFGEMPGPNNASNDDIFGSFSSAGYDDLIPGFGASSPPVNRTNTKATKSTDDPFVVLESVSSPVYNSSETPTDPLEGFSMFNQPGGEKYRGPSNATPPLRPPPKPAQVLKADKVKSSSVSQIDDLENFAMGNVRNKTSRSKEAEDAKKKPQEWREDDLESFLGVSFRSNSVPKSRAATLDPMFDTNVHNRQQKTSATVTVGIDDLSSIFGDAQIFGEFEEVEGETEERRRARLERHQRTQDRVARAVADMNQRDRQSQHEQEERRRIAEAMDFEIKRWSAGKEGNMRALLSSLQQVLWAECGWEPVSLTDLITSGSVKKVYRKATLCVHPDKVQQKGATLEQKYIAEKVFDILKEAWNKFNKEELS